MTRGTLISSRRFPAKQIAPSRIEALEPRQLLSAYTFSETAAFGSRIGFPIGQPVLDSSGNLFGLFNGDTQGGIYEVAKGSSTPTVLATFPTGTNVFGVPSPSIDANGNLFGLISLNNEAGDTGTEQDVIYELPKGGSSIQTLVSLATDEVEDGSTGGGHLLVDSNGDLFGTDRDGGANGGGYIFELPAGASSLTTLASFPEIAVTGIGNRPEAPNLTLTMDSSGDLFGTTNGGGNSIGTGDGSVFELPAGSSTIQALASFNQNTGIYPQSGVVMDSSGNLYGSVLDITDGSLPAIGEIGSIFELPAGSGTPQTLATFTAATGYGTAYPLAIDSSGNIFGATQYGGMVSSSLPNGGGVAFELPAGSGAIEALKTFGTGGIQTPAGGVTLDATTGNLFGQVGGTGVGGANGEVYELSMGGGGGGGGGGGTAALSGTLTGKLPATSVIAGQKTSITQKLTLTDSGSAALKGPAPVTYYLSSGTTIDGSSIPLPGSATAHLNLKAGHHAVVNFHLKSVPASTPDGSYYIVAQVAASTGTIDAASASTITVAPAEIDLSGSFVKVSPMVKTGKKLALTVTLTNNGNVPATGLLPVQIDLSTDDADDQNLVLPGISQHINLKPGKTMHLTLHDVVAEADGSYFVFVKLDPANTFSDVNLSNNDFQSPTASLTVSG